MFVGTTFGLSHTSRDDAIFSGLDYVYMLLAEHVMVMA